MRIEYMAEAGGRQRRVGAAIGAPVPVALARRIRVAEKRRIITRNQTALRALCQQTHGRGKVALQRQRHESDQLRESRFDGHQESTRREE